MKRNDLFWAIVLIVVGLVLLIGRWLSISIWGILWPIMLVILGGWLIYSAARRKSFETETLVIPLANTASALVRLKHGAGRLSLNADVDSDELLSGSFVGGVELHREGEVNASLDLRTPSGVFPILGGPGALGAPSGLDWKLGLSRDVELSLEMETGLAEARLDLEDLRVVDLRLKTGLSAARVTMPSGAGHTRAVIESGLGSLSVHVPEGVAARIRVESGLGSVHVAGARFPGAGSAYQSPNYETAANKLDLEIKSGLGSVSVK